MKPSTFEPSARRGFLFLCLILSCIAYLALRRDWVEIFLYSYIAAMPIAYMFLRREGRIYLDRAQTPSAKLRVSITLLLPTLFVAAIITPIGSLFYGLGAALIDIFHWIVTTLSERGRSTSLAVAATALVGFFLFVFRLKFRCIYGLTEAIVGLLVAGQRVNTEKSVSADVALLLALLTAGVYLVVRGLDNIHQGWKARSDPAANWLLKGRDDATVR